MKLIIESTDKIVELRTADGASLPARVWQGESEGGVPVHCYVTRVAVENGLPESCYAAFEAELSECAAARPDVAAVPLRLIL